MTPPSPDCEGHSGLPPGCRSRPPPPTDSGVSSANLPPTISLLGVPFSLVCFYSTTSVQWGGVGQSRRCRRVMIRGQVGAGGCFLPSRRVSGQEEPFVSVPLIVGCSLHRRWSRSGVQVQAGATGARRSGPSAPTHFLVTLERERSVSEPRWTHRPPPQMFSFVVLIPPLNFFVSVSTECATL